MTQEHWDRLQPILIESCTGLFKENGAALAYAGPHGAKSTTEESVVAFIGFTGAHIKGHLLITAPLDWIRQTHPMTGASSVSDEDARDWAGELTNQLIGRLKNRLLCHGVSFDLSTPMSLVGSHLRGVPIEKDDARLLLFYGERLAPPQQQGQGSHDGVRPTEMELQLRFHLVDLPGLVFSDVSTVVPDQALEGEMVLF